MNGEKIETEQSATATAGAADGHVCGCEHDDSDIVLDVRTIPHAVRHAAVRGAFSAIPVGGSLVLVAPHRPMPLLAELDADANGALAIQYLAEEPSECHVRLTRTVLAV
ncbi:DUF2249 domain-containing protein [Cellulomonas sp. P24]|uniref:DUF2249 domain-containing protein n=1 Tax=Cellulomonas sp. P24 TaxID=2885206 RepID=UPI00216B2191|nr:DUF2249 domain-containing protein [Cellulomonas sp. P24]MCR6491088.1 DUF2249 domain-containing protein [Cellulomonas sp. P24]